ncbi:MAG: gamma-glutamylcyclotransferase [Alphaproteobacteria bacterium]
MDHQPSYKTYLSLVESLQPFYVFGFGSLIWHPDFDYEKKFYSRILGFHRRFGLWSIHYRGTIEKPGLVLGLDRGGSTTGICFQIPNEKKIPVAKKLWEREMISLAYQPLIATVLIAKDMIPIYALAFALDPNHKQYVKPTLSLKDKAKIIASASGNGGSNKDYFFNMAQSLKKMNITDHYINSLASELKNIG